MENSSSDQAPSSQSGRRAQAALNDKKILDSARAVFTTNPDAPIAAVAEHAGVGISALYNRYASKEELLRKLCTDGLQTTIDEAEVFLADGRDPWVAFSDYMQRLVDADTSSMTLALAGKFMPTPEMFALAEKSSEIGDRVFKRCKKLLRSGININDLSLVFEMIAAISVADPTRTRELRQRYLMVILDGLRAQGKDALPHQAPTWQEISERWIPKAPSGD